MEQAGIDTDGARPRLTLTSDEHASAAEWLSGHGIESNGAPIVGVHPGGDWVYKLWGAPRFAAVADGLVDRHAANVLVFAGPSEKALQQEVAAAMRQNARISFAPFA